MEDFIDSTEMFCGIFADLQDQRILPPSGVTV